MREWLNRAARAPRDRAWVAEGVISDHWAPVSPSGVLDAFVWRTPDERLTASVEPPPRRPRSRPRRRRAVIEPPPPPPPPRRQRRPARSSRLRRAARRQRPPASAARARVGHVVMLPSAAPDDPGPPRPEGDARLPAFRPRMSRNSPYSALDRGAALSLKAARPAGACGRALFSRDKALETPAKDRQSCAFITIATPISISSRARRSRSSAMAARATRICSTCATAASRRSPSRCARVRLRPRRPRPKASR